MFKNEKNDIAIISYSESFSSDKESAGCSCVIGRMDSSQHTVLTNLIIFSYQTAYIQIKIQANHYHSCLIKVTLSKTAISIISTVEN